MVSQEKMKFLMKIDASVNLIVKINKYSAMMLILIEEFPKKFNIGENRKNSLKKWKTIQIQLYKILSRVHTLVCFNVTYNSVNMKN